MSVYTIKNQEGYETLSARVDKGALFLEGKWFDPNYEREVNHYNAMAHALLKWELDTDIFETEFDKWRRDYG